MAVTGARSLLLVIFRLGAEVDADGAEFAIAGFLVNATDPLSHDTVSQCGRLAVPGNYGIGRDLQRERAHGKRHRLQRFTALRLPWKGRLPCFPGWPGFGRTTGVRLCRRLPRATTQAWRRSAAVRRLSTVILEINFVHNG